MAVIDSLHLQSVRNIEQADLALSPSANLLFGSNGAGKTSVLEAVALLATGKSFRTHKAHTLIRQSRDHLLVTARLQQGSKLGLLRDRKKAPLLKLDEAVQRNWESIARLLPVQSLDSKAFDLLLGGPGERRSFLDWGVFHVEHDFVEHWRAARKCLAQRNLLLRSGVKDSAQYEPWESELAKRAVQIDEARQRYLARYAQLFKPIYNELAGTALDIEIGYRRGWPEDVELWSALRSSRVADQRLGATQSGPHRADIVFKTAGGKAVDVLSRGQAKLLVYSLKIAQGLFLADDTGSKPVFLLDDLPSELDEDRRGRVIALLYSSGAQLLLSAVERHQITQCLPQAADCRLFHVEHGKITDS
jgi:DNA replication and repair protein RecF